MGALLLPVALKGQRGNSNYNSTYRGEGAAGHVMGAETTVEPCQSLDLAREPEPEEKILYQPEFSRKEEPVGLIGLSICRSIYHLSIIYLDLLYFEWVHAIMGARKSKMGRAGWQAGISGTISTLVLRQNSFFSKKPQFLL